MLFCTKCGHQIADGTKFCPECGAAIAQATTDTEAHEHSQGQRKQTFIGEVRKCPSCGEILKSFTAICPACGHELKLSEISLSVKEFSEKISECDRAIAHSSVEPRKGWSSWSKGIKIVWVILNIYTLCIPLFIYFVVPLLGISGESVFTAEEKQKAAFIKNYTFPNERESIVEALLFIKSQLEFLATEKTNLNKARWVRIWKNKADQLHQKAEMMFPDDKVSNKAYNDIIISNKKVKQSLIIRVAIATVLVITFTIFMLIRNGTIDTTNYRISYDWPDNEFTEVLPKPEAKYGKITWEATQSFRLELYKITPTQFDAYITACKDSGFTIDATKSDSMFSASNADGYDLILLYFESEKELHISIDSYGVN